LPSRQLVWQKRLERPFATIESTNQGRQHVRTVADATGGAVAKSWNDIVLEIVSLGSGW
jgi:hypothetical protein